MNREKFFGFLVANRTAYETEAARRKALIEKFGAAGERKAAGFARRAAARLAAARAA